MKALENPLIRTGGLLVGLLIVLALAAPLLTRWHVLHEPIQQDQGGLNEDGMPRPVGGKYLLGTDNLGRDLLSRVVHGTRVSSAFVPGWQKAVYSARQRKQDLGQRNNGECDWNAVGGRSLPFNDCCDNGMWNAASRPTAIHDHDGCVLVQLDHPHAGGDRGVRRHPGFSVAGRGQVAEGHPLGQAVGKWADSRGRRPAVGVGEKVGA